MVPYLDSAIKDTRYMIAITTEGPDFRGKTRVRLSQIGSHKTAEELKENWQRHKNGSIVSYQDPKQDAEQRDKHRVAEPN